MLRSMKTLCLASTLSFCVLSLHACGTMGESERASDLVRAADLVPLQCGKGTVESPSTDRQGDVTARHCLPTNPQTVKCGDSTTEHDGGGGTVDRDGKMVPAIVVCQATNPQIVKCGAGTTEHDGGGGTVDRDGEMVPAVVVCLPDGA